MNLSIIIVNYNTAHFINQTINSIYKSSIDIDYEIIVVDNKSHDNSVELLTKSHPDIKLIENTENYGFAKAINIGADNSNGKHILLLNPDTIVEKESIQTLYNSLIKDSHIGIVGARIIDSDGKFQLSSRRRYPSFLTSLFQISGLSYLFPKSRLFGRYNYTHISSKISHEVDSVSGACMMFSREHFSHLNGFDEDYFLFFEETDFCIRTKSMGKKILYNANAETIHYRGESMKTASFNVNNIFLESLIIFYKKQGSTLLGSFFFRPLLKFSLFLKRAGSYVKSNLRLIYQSILDIISISIAYTLSIPFWYANYYHVTINTDTYIKHTPLLFNYFLTWMVVSSIFKIYRRGFSINKDIALVNILVFLIASTTTYFLNAIAYSRVILLLIFMQTFLFSFLWRYLFSFFTNYKIINSKKLTNIFFQRVALIGSTRKTISLIEKINSASNIYKNIVGYFDGQKGNLDIKYLGTIDSINRAIYEENIDEIIIDESDIYKLNIFNLLSKTSGRPVIVKILPNDGNLLLSKGMIEFIDGMSLIKLELPYLDNKHKIIKRIFDVFFSFLLILLSSPIHIFYSLFKYQFVSIRTIGGEKINVINYCSRNNVIKKLPYLWFILTGHLSFVGSEIINDENEGKKIILIPGVTGLYRLNSSTSLNEQKKYDFYYMENYSILLDFEIIIRTISLR